MAKLLRDATTGEYYTETAMDGEFVTLRIHPDGSDYLVQEGVEEGSRIPAEMLVVLEENEWVSVAETGAYTTRQYADGTVLNESETNAPPSDGPDPHIDDLPSNRLEPRPWMEQENVERMRAETDPTAAGTGQSERRFSSTPADRDNANPMTHPEDAAFVGGVWFWVLVVAAVAIIVWGLFEIL